jgi:DNA-nicking Smr family endonuclease
MTAGGRRPAPDDVLLADDVALFRAEVAGITPLPTPDRANLRSPRPKPRPRQREADEARVMHDAFSDPWDVLTLGDSEADPFFVRPGVPHSALRKLRRGSWILQGELDLHGHSSDEARTVLAAFLARCGQFGHRCVRVIHGKGLSSPNRVPVLKNKVRHWLRQRDDVLAFCPARPADGGAGALIVLLKSTPMR